MIGACADRIIWNAAGGRLLSDGGIVSMVPTRVARQQGADLEWSDFSQALNLIEAGAKATRENIPQIRRAISGMNRWFPVKKILRNILQD